MSEAARFARGLPAIHPIDPAGFGLIVKHDICRHPAGALFRDLPSPSGRAGVALAAGAALKVLEWRRHHLPSGDLVLARRIARLCRDVGFQPLSYGSYVMPPQDQGGCFQAEPRNGVGAWRPAYPYLGGTLGSSLGQLQHGRVIKGRGGDRGLAELAREQRVSIGLAYHPDTLTGMAQLVLDLLDEIASGNDVVG